MATLKIRCFGDAPDQSDGFGLTSGVPMGLLSCETTVSKKQISFRDDMGKVEHDQFLPGFKMFQDVLLFSGVNLVY